MASEDGVIYDPEGGIRNTYNNADGYITCSVKLLDNSWVTFGVQRLVALAHLECPGDPADYVVNHIDLNIENNHISNLEWVTVEQNNIHAALFNLQCTRIQLRGAKLGTIVADGKRKHHEPIFSMTIANMSHRSGISQLDIWKSIKDSVPVSGWRFYYIKSGEKPKELHSDKQFAKGVSRDAAFYTKKPIWIKDLDTDEIIEYESVTAAGKAHKVPQNHVNFAICREGKPRLFKGSYLVSDNGEFPELTAEEIEKRKSSGGRTVVGYLVEKKQMVLSSSASSFVKEYSLSKKAITTALKNNRLVVRSDWLFTYDSPENRERLFEEIKRLAGCVQAESKE